MPVLADAKKFLRTAREKWGESRDRAKEAKGFAELPDDRYVCRFTGWEISQSQTKNTWMLVLSYTVIEGPHVGEIIKDFRGLEGEDSWYYAALTLKALGVDLDAISEKTFEKDFEAAMDALVAEKPALVLQLRTKAGSDFQNKNVQKLLGEDYESEESEEDVEDEEEEEEEETEEEEEEEAEEEAEEEEEDEPEVRVGQIVSYPWKGDTAEGEITELLPDDGLVKIRTETGGKKVFRKISPEELTLIRDVGEEEEEEEEEAPPPPKKTAAAAKTGTARRK